MTSARHEDELPSEPPSASHVHLAATLGEYVDRRPVCRHKAPIYRWPQRKRAGPSPCRRKNPLKRSLPIAVFAVALLTVGCTTRYIGNTLIEDTETNRDILLVLEKYRKAVEDRDIQRILDLTSDEFFEDPGTPSD